MRTPASISRSAGQIPSPRFRSVVGHAHTMLRADAELMDLFCVHVDGMDGRKTFVQYAALVQQCYRAQAVLRDTGIHLGRLFGDMHVDRAAHSRAHSCTIQK